MTQNELGRLARVDLRQVWQSEPGDFTPWLAEEQNIDLLGGVLGVELVVEAQEANVGLFRADILCRNVGTDEWVLIENQLERTDHTHLGQLITYAAGLDTVTIVWIAQRFTDEHRAALDWLNEMTSEEVSFFGLEVELLRIGDSQIAPQFNVISSPNNWSRAARRVTREAGDRSDLRVAKINFWTAVRDKLIDAEVIQNEVRVHPSGFTFSAGKHTMYFNPGMYEKRGFANIRLKIHSPDHADVRDWLEANQESLPSLAGCEMTFRSGSGSSDVTYTRDGISYLASEAELSRMQVWFASSLGKLKPAFYQLACDYEASQA